MTVYAELGPLPVVSEPKALRQTLLRAFDRCPHSAYLYLRHDGGVDSHPLFRGRAFHETVERCTRACIAHGATQVDQHHAKAVLQEVLLAHPDWVIPATELDDLRIMVWRWAETFQAPVGALVEQLFHLGIGGRTVSGTVDLAWVDGDTIHIRDYKTGRGLPTQDEISGKDEAGRPKGAKSAQLIIYSLLMADGHPVGLDWRIPAGINRFDCRFVFPFFNTDDGLVERGLVIERPELIEHREWLQVLLKRVAAGFEQGIWPAVPGSHCGECPAPGECPIPAVLRKRSGESPYERDPSELAEEWMFMTADADRLRKNMKDYANRFGPIPIGSDLELSHKRVDSKRMSKAGKDALAAGAPVPADAYTTSTSTKFGVHKRGEGF